jgi:hypothetical protein
MTIDKLRKAIALAQTFQKAGAAAIERILTKSPVSLTCGSKETAAARRASMDLTRALADLRKS